MGRVVERLGTLQSLGRGSEKKWTMDRRRKERHTMHENKEEGGDDQHDTET